MAAAATTVSDEAYLEPDNATAAEATDSAVESDIDSTRSTSITSSITGYKYENGRRYHAYREGAYYLPNDEAEQARLDLVHHISLLALDGALYLAPLSKDVKRCLDFGTGTGIWAIDFADEFPNAEVIGTDLSPIQPTWVPPNLKFWVDDVEADWNYSRSEAFDFIHGRGMGGAIKDWPRLLRQIHQNLKPGGYLQVDDYESWWYTQNDPGFEKCPNAQKWVEVLNEGSSKFGSDLNMGPKLKEFMTQAGFENVTERIVKIPVGPWAKGKKAKEIGVFQQANILDCVDSYTIGLTTRVLGWTPEEAQVLVARTKGDIRDRKNQLYVHYYFVYGQKGDSST